jgi:hypothetical protein
MSDVCLSTHPVYILFGVVVFMFMYILIIKLVGILRLNICNVISLSCAQFARILTVVGTEFFSSISICSHLQ